MSLLAELRTLDRDQRAAVVASLLGWTLDAFDFFLMVFVLRSIAGDFHAEMFRVSFAVTLTLMFRPLGAFVFGWLADTFGRRPVLMADILLYSLFELLSAFAPSLTALLILRALFGFAMGGEWGIGASLVMETVPAQSRGLISGLLQQGYPLGYLLASIVYGLFFNYIGWRGLFALGVLPALLIFYIRSGVKESPVWQAGRRAPDKVGLFRSIGINFRRFLYVILLMTVFNFFSHGTQDLYPTFLQAQHHLGTHVVSTILIVANLGAIVGGVTFGAYSQRVGRRRAILTALIIGLPIIPFWAFAATPLLLGVGAFFMQLAVQGAWGVVPAHLNELSPEEARGTFPGFAYQIGNLIAAGNATLQVGLAASAGGNYAVALATVTVVTVFVLGLITFFGPENKEVVFGEILTSKAPSS
jgi:SHS family lactate transporter-like MFS transporter